MSCSKEPPAFVVEMLPTLVRDRAIKEWPELTSSQQAAAIAVAENVRYEQNKLFVAIFINQVMQQKMAAK